MVGVGIGGPGVGRPPWPVPGWLPEIAAVSGVERPPWPVPGWLPDIAAVPVPLGHSSSRVVAHINVCIVQNHRLGAFVLRCAVHSVQFLVFEASAPMRSPVVLAVWVVCAERAVLVVLIVLDKTDHKGGRKGVLAGGVVVAHLVALVHSAHFVLGKTVHREG